MKAHPEFMDVLGSTVGQGMLGLGPDKLVRVELGSISGKTMHMEPCVFPKEVSDVRAPMDTAPIPEEYDLPSQVAQKVAKETDDFHAGNVGRVEADIQAHAFARRRDRDAGDCGDPIPFITVPQNRRITQGRPGLANVGDEEKAAFVEEDEMGPKSFFLYEAKSASSSVRWLPRLSAGHVAPASASSILDSSATGRYSRDGTGYQNASE